MRRRVLGTTLALPLAALSCRGRPSGQTAPAARSSTGAQVTQPQPAASAAAAVGAGAGASAPAAFAVGLRTLTFVDAGRSTAPRSGRGGPATPGRTLATAVYYPAGGTSQAGGAAPGGNEPVEGAPPATGGPYPLILFSHGLRGLPRDYQALLAHWVLAGAVVVAPSYPLTSRGAEDVTPGDLLNQPADASFVLTSLLGQAAQAGDPFRGVLDW